MVPLKINDTGTSKNKTQWRAPNKGHNPLDSAGAQNVPHVYINTAP